MLTEPKLKIIFLPALCFILTLCGIFAVSAEQVGHEEATLTTVVSIKVSNEHDFALVADYHPGAKRSGGVIVLHDCKSDRRRYKKVATSLAEQGLHTLLVDLRGYGESVAEGFSRTQIKKNAVNIVNYQSEMALLTTYWQDDLLASYQFLRSKLPANKGISIVASGCSGAYAVALAEKVLLHSMVLITPKMTYSDKECYKNLIDIPSYFITSSRHQDSYQTAQELFAWNGAQQSKMQVFKGDSYAYQLINRSKHLIKDVAHWIMPTLEN
ncbi:hypothetical protein A9Q74_17825 [Colwellia sp. 39_35_sub15_T18]|nr:hypothetical protein A9Q74_17825 [Colwellia sp. 39_35_sub15_T18]